MQLCEILIILLCLITGKYNKEKKKKPVKKTEKPCTKEEPAKEGQEEPSFEHQVVNYVYCVEVVSLHGIFDYCIGGRHLTIH